jgi:hypothetical protein
MMSCIDYYSIETSSPKSLTEIGFIGKLNCNPIFLYIKLDSIYV